MKNGATTLLLMLIGLNGFSQDLRFEVRGLYARPVSREILAEARTLGDITPGYPSSWVTDYVSSTVEATCGGNVMKAVSPNDTLSAEQKRILLMADMGTEIAFDIDYLYKNTVTYVMDTRLMHFAVTIAPEKEAHFPGGMEQLNAYLAEHAIQKISRKNSKKLSGVVIRFTVTEDGQIANAHVSGPSEIPAVDKVVLDAIRHMPNWNPAETSKGTKVKQVFEFIVGNVGC